MGPEGWRGEVCRIVWAGKKVFNSIRDIGTVVAVRGRGSIDGVEVALEFRTVARTELGKDCSIMSVEGKFRGINFRRDISKNWIGGRG